MNRKIPKGRTSNISKASDTLDPPSSKSIGNFFKTAEVAQILRTSSRSLQRWIRDGEIEAIKIGKGYKIHEDEIKRFLEAKKIRPQKRDRPE